VTPEALAVIRHSLELAAPGLTVRLRVAGGQVRPHFVAEPVEGDSVVETEGIRVFVAAGIGNDVVIDATQEHGNLLVR